MGFFLLDNPQPNTQQWGYPRRGAKLTGTCIMHTAECALDNVGEDTSAEGTAAFIKNRSDHGSYHCLVDSDSIIWMVPWEYETWQDLMTNPWAVGISAAVQADNWHLIPADRKDRIYRNLAICAADFVIYMRDAYGITVPLKRITGAQARAGVPGFCAHGDSGVDRHDPGVQFDWALFFTYTGQALGGAAIAPQGITDTKEWYEMASIPKDNLLQIVAALKSKDFAAFIQTSVMNATAPSADGKKWTLASHLKGTSVRTVQLVKDVASLSGQVAAARNEIKQLAAKTGVELDKAQVEAAVAEGTRKALAEAQAVDAKLIADAVVDEQAARLSGKEAA